MQIEAVWTDAAGNFVRRLYYTFGDYRQTISTMFHNGWEMLPPHGNEIMCMVNPNNTRERIAFTLVDRAFNPIS